MASDERCSGCRTAGLYLGFVVLSEDQIWDPEIHFKKKGPPHESPTEGPSFKEGPSQKAGFGRLRYD